MLARLTSRLRDQRGTTLTELVVVALLLGMVSAVIMTSLTSTMKVASTVHDQNASIQDIRTAIEVVERDLRAANPIEAAEPVSLFATELSFSVFCSTPGTDHCGNDNLRAVTFRLTGNQLVRIQGGATQVLVGPSGPVHLPDAQQRGAIVNASTQPVFRYFDKDGDELATSGSSAPSSSQFRDCVKHVQIYLVVITEAGSTTRTADLTTTGTLRNFNEVSGC